MPSGDNPVLLHGPALVGLVKAVNVLAAEPIGDYAIVGGVAVTVRVGSAHRSTTDVDTVVDEGVVPSALEVLLRQPGAVPGGRFQQVFLDGTKVELLPVGRVRAGDVDGLPDEQALFVTSHAWALETATVVTIIAVDDPQGRRVTARFATPSALVACKLHAIEDRHGVGVEKRGSDALDLFRLLADLDEAGGVSDQFRTASPELRRLTVEAAVRVLVAGAGRTAGWMRSAGVDAVGADELQFVATRFITAIGSTR